MEENNDHNHSLVDYLLDLEVQGVGCMKDYLEGNPDINQRMIVGILKWLFEVAESLKLRKLAFFLTCEILKLYVHRKKGVKRKNLQRVGCASLHIADTLCAFSGYSNIDDYVYVTSGIFTKDQLIEMVEDIIVTTSIELILPNSYSFFQGIAEPPDRETMKIYITVLTITSIYDYGLKDYRRSLIAATIVHMVSGVVKTYSLEEMGPVCFAIRRVLVENRIYMNEIFYKNPSDNLWGDTMENVMKNMKLYQCSDERKFLLPVEESEHKDILSDSLDAPGDTVGKGVFGIVSKVKGDIINESSEFIAIKRISSVGRFDDTERNTDYIIEVAILALLSGEPSINTLKKISFKEKEILLALKYEEADLFTLIGDLYFEGNENLIVKYALQMLETLQILKHYNILHADIKSKNILVDTSSDSIKFADFGISIPYFSPGEEYRSEIITAMNRPPEIFLKDGFYDYGADLWSVVCVIVELYLCVPIFAANGYKDEKIMTEIFKVTGSYSHYPDAESRKHNSKWYIRSAINNYNFVFPNYKGDINRVFKICKNEGTEITNKFIRKVIKGVFRLMNKDRLSIDDIMSF